MFMRVDDHQYATVYRMELLTVAETAKLLRVSPITVRRRIADGQLDAVRVGKGIRVPMDAIERFLRPADDGRASKRRLIEGQGMKMATWQDRGHHWVGYFLSDKYDPTHERMTPEEQEYFAQAIEASRQLREEDLAKRGGQPWPPAWKIIREMREERSRRLS